MGKTFTAIGIVQEVNVEGDEAVIIAYDTRASKMRAIRILKKDFDKYFTDADLKRSQGIEKKEYKAIVEQMIKDGKAYAADPKKAKKANRCFVIL